MSDGLNKKLAELLGKVDEKVLQTKINTALDMLQKGNTEELAKKMKKVDKEELISKLDELDMKKLQNMNIDMNEIRSKISDADMQAVSKMLGENGDEIMNKIKTLLNQK